MGYRDRVIAMDPLGYWPLDGPSDSADLSGNGHTATWFPNGNTGARGGPSIVRNEAGRRSTLVDLSANAYYEVTSGSWLNIPSMTYTGWYLTNVSSQVVYPFARDNGGSSGDNRAFQIAVLTTGNLRIVDNGSTNVVAGNRTDLNNGRIHMIGFHYTTNLVEFWIDGILDKTSAGVTAPATASTTNLSLRRHNTAGGNILGTLGHVAVFNRRLTPGEWRALYVAGMGAERGQHWLAA